MRPGGRSLLGVYLLLGLVFQLLYFGLPWPLNPATWLHVLGWPVFVLLGVLRRVFFLFALVALVVLGGLAFLRSRA